METLGSIKKIRDLKVTITEQLSGVTWKDTEFTCGPENEYNAKSLMGGIKGLMADITMLTKAPAQFVKLSTHSERTAIAQNLQSIELYIDQANNNLSNQVDNLKTLLRPYCTRTRKEWFEEVGKSSDLLIKKQLELEASLVTAKNIIEEAASLRDQMKSSFDTFDSEKDEASSEFNSKLEALEALETSLEEKIEKLGEQIEELDTQLTTVQDTEGKIDSIHESVSESKVEVSSNEKVIDGFTKKVTEREKAFQDLIAKTEENTTQLTNFQTERKSSLKEAKKLIDSAKLALEYKTAEGLSAAFSTEKNSHGGFSRYAWLILSGACLAIAIYLGNSILGLSKDELPMIIGRLALVPLPLGAMWFCAGQYVKISNIWADYGYKMTLAKSLVGFSEELKKHSGDSEEEYRHYIKTVLEQIHQDPLRSRKVPSSKKSSDNSLKESKGVIDLVEKIVKLTKGADSN